MTGLTEQLQAESLDLTVPVSSLLRKVKLAAVKLHLAEAADWVDAELNGYGNDDEVPEYRKLTGILKAYSPRHGWQTIGGSSQIVAALAYRQLGSPIAALEDLLKEPDGDELILMPVSPEVRAALLKGNYGWTDAATIIGRGEIVAIVDHVRNTVLNWALDLERAGIMGEGISFSRAEQEKATAAHITIGTFSGNLHAGDVSGSHARSNLGSTDNSTNIESSDSVFGGLQTAIRNGIEDDHVAEQLITLVREMQSAKGTPNFLSRYVAFMSAAANHMTILAPFLPALAAILPAQ